MTYCAPYCGPCGPLEKIYLNENQSDVSILLKNEGSTWKFPAHALLLSSQSIVFQRMLEGDFSERKQKEVVIESMDPFTLERLLWYIYYGKMLLESWTEAISLLQAAHKYQMDLLVQKCEAYLEGAVNLSNVCHILNETALYSLQSLKTKCLDLIRRGAFVILHSKGIESLSKNIIMEVVSNCLNVDSEVVIVECLLRWAAVQCCKNSKPMTEENILEEIRPFLEHIYFSDMTSEEKSTLPSYILSLVDSPLYIESQNKERPKCSKLTIGIDTETLPFCNYFKFKRSYTMYTKVFAPTTTCLRFSVDRPLFLLGFDFSYLADSSSYCPSRYSLWITKETNSDTNSFQFKMNNCRSESNGKKHRYKEQAYLEMPLRLEEKTPYSIVSKDSTSSLEFAQYKIPNEKYLLTRSGNVNFAFHCKTILSVSNLICLT